MTNLESPQPEPQRPETTTGDGEQSHIPSAEETRSVDDVISDALAEAAAADSEIPEWGARAIARSLAAQTDAPTPALHALDVTADADLEAVSAEVMPLYNQPDCPDSVRRQIDYLLTFLLGRQRPLEAPAVTGGATAPRELPERAQEGIRLYGDAFRAFLKLPDISADAPDLLETFGECYLDRFASMDDILDSLTERHYWQVAIDELADRLGIPGYIVLDQELIADHTRDTWDIVRYGGALYVFDK